jgi:hypothetical protein
MSCFARLAQTQAKHESLQLELGVKAGTEWAEQTATALQLRRLVKVHARLSSGYESPDWDDFFGNEACILFASGRDGGRRGWLAKIIEPDFDVDVFWGDALGDDWWSLTEESMFLKGFCVGSLSVWVDWQERP